jgi:hypothetical protein
MTDVLDDLRDLHKQATTERSHNYVAACALRAINEIECLRAAVDIARSALLRVEQKSEEARAVITRAMRSVKAER